MQLQTPDFSDLASRIGALAQYSELLDSCAKLMSDTMVQEGTLYCLSDSTGLSAATQLATTLNHSPESLRPELPAMTLQLNAAGMSHFNAIASAGDFAFFIGTQEYPSDIDQWLDICLEKEITTVLINPDLDSVAVTDKALELRLEYRSFSDYLSSLSMVSNYLVKSIELHLFGSPNSC